MSFPVLNLLMPWPERGHARKFAVIGARTSYPRSQSHARQFAYHFLCWSVVGWANSVGRLFGEAGRSTRNVVPAPGRLRTSIKPWRLRTITWTAARPSPRPVNLVEQ